MSVSKKLTDAIDLVEDEEVEMSFLERFDNLGQELIANAFTAIKKIKKYGKKHPISEEEEYVQIECMKQFKTIDRVLNTLTRANRIKAKPNEHFDEQLLKKIKEKKSTIGEIVRQLPPIQENGHK